MPGIEDLFRQFDANTNQEQILIRILKAVATTAAAIPVPPGALATEATQQLVLAELMKNLDFELKCVRDTVTGTIYVMQINKDINTGTVTVTYLDATGAVVVPPNPGDLVVCDADAALNAILAEVAKLTAPRTPVIITQTTNHTVPIGATEVSIFNNGSSDITINGVICPPGFKRAYGFNNPISVALNVVASGNQVLIDYMT